MAGSRTKIRIYISYTPTFTPISPPPPDARSVETRFGLRYPEEGQRALFSQHGPGFPADVEHDAERAGEKEGSEKTEQRSAEKRSSKGAQKEKQKERAQKTQEQPSSSAFDEEEEEGHDEREADGVHEMQVQQEDQGGHSRAE